MLNIVQASAFVRSVIFAPAFAIVLVTGATFGMVACDGETPPVDGGPNEPGVGPGEPGVEPPVDDLAMRLCILTVRGSATFSESFDTVFNPRLRCEAVFQLETIDDADARQQCLDSPEDLAVFSEAVSGGRVTINVERLDACLNKSRSFRAGGASVVEYDASEGDLFLLGVDDDCTGAFVGTRNENEACVQPWDCTGDLLCQAAALDDELRCITPAREDALCGASRTCGAGLTCESGRCAAPVASGRPCAFGGTACIDDNRCLLTSSEPIEVYTCVPDQILGETCADPALRCVAGTKCLNDVCVEVAHPVNGGSCELDGDSCLDECSVCRPTTANGQRTCVTRSDAGRTCLDDDHCLLGLYCTVDTNVCVALGAVDAPCDDPRPCEAGLFCGSNAQCQPLGVDDDACTADRECAAAFYCFNGNVCRTRVGPGANCNSTTPCAADLLCLETVCQAGRENDLCRVASTDCGTGLKCIVEGPDCPPNDGQCIQDNPQGACAVPPQQGEPCGGRFNVCDDAFYCPDGDTCVLKLATGSTCEVDAHCASGFCIDGGTCATPTPSCLASQGNGFVMLLFGAFVPFALRLRRRRRA